MLITLLYYSFKFTVLPARAPARPGPWSGPALSARPAAAGSALARSAAALDENARRRLRLFKKLTVVLCISYLYI